MRVHPSEPKPMQSRSSIALGPEPSQRSAEGASAPISTASDSSPIATAALVPADGTAAYALLAEQCRGRVDALPPRYRDVLAGLVAGYSNKQIAYQLGLSTRTVEAYRAGMMSRLKTRRLAQALHIAFIAGLVPAEAVSPKTR